MDAPRKILRLRAFAGEANLISATSGCPILISIPEHVRGIGHLALGVTSVGIQYRRNRASFISSPRFDTGGCLCGACSIRWRNGVLVLVFVRSAEEGRGGSSRAWISNCVVRPGSGVDPNNSKCNA